jgi:ADP-ribosyl-[dinitrogen reductase] hydrolase
MDEVGSRVWAHRVIGCVVGSAVGDALGAPFEFGPPGQWTARFGDGPGEMLGGGSFGWAPGQFTDDTEMATIVAESLLACQRHDPDDQLERFRAWGAHATDVGNLTREVLASGLPADRAAQHVLQQRNGRHTAGNGSIMRAAPGAVHYAVAGRATTVEAGRRLSAVTHADPLCQWAVAIQHELVRCLLEGVGVDEAVASALDALPADMAAVYEPLLHPAWTPTADGPGNGSAMGALAQSVWALRRERTFAAVVAAVIDLGDDTDSVAAVAGALAGARFGVGAIPARWLEPLHGVVMGVDGMPTRYDAAELWGLSLALVGAVASDGQVIAELGDEPFLTALAAVTEAQWARLRRVLDDLTVPDVDSWVDLAGGARELMDLLYEIGLVVPFDWPAWWAASPLHGTTPADVSTVSDADAVRLITVYLRADRFDEGEFGARLADGSLPSLLRRWVG